jgi:hypothetical protein
MRTALAGWRPRSGSANDTGGSTGHVGVGALHVALADPQEVGDAVGQLTEPLAVWVAHPGSASPNPLGRPLGQSGSTDG